EHTPGQAATALELALKARFQKLDESGVDQLQKTHGALAGHVALFEHVLRSHLVNARLIDANFNGDLDGGDIAWVKNAAGRIEVTAISQALADRVKVGA